MRLGVVNRLRPFGWPLWVVGPWLRDARWPGREMRWIRPVWLGVGDWLWSWQGFWLRSWLGVGLGSWLGEGVTLDVVSFGGVVVEDCAGEDGSSFGCKA